MNLIIDRLIPVRACGAESIEQARQCDFYHKVKLRGKERCLWRGGFRCYSVNAAKDYDDNREAGCYGEDEK